MALQGLPLAHLSKPYSINRVPRTTMTATPSPSTICSCCKQEKTADEIQHIDWVELFRDVPFCGPCAISIKAKAARRLGDTLTFSFDPLSQ